MVSVVGVRFRKAGKIYYFNPGDLEFSEGEKVVVETVRGLECGEVAGGVKEVAEGEITQPLKDVVRKATPEDERIVQENVDKERKAFKLALEKIEARDLPMKLVDVEYAFDGSKIIFFFTADGRVDFRELVRDLASVFRTRIELRQIGVRDEAKMVGGLGTCGRPLCCATFLGAFEPVSIRMAKDQNLSLNPTKISGMCGRLMCCLKYEHDVYKELRKELPPIGSEIETETGTGKVVDLNVLQGIATVKTACGKTMNVYVHGQGSRFVAAKEKDDQDPPSASASLPQAAGRRDDITDEEGAGETPPTRNSKGRSGGRRRASAEPDTTAAAGVASEERTGQQAGRPRKRRRRRQRRKVSRAPAPNAKQGAGKERRDSKTAAAGDAERRI